MGWNYRRSRKIAPGLRLNFSNRGIGFSVGPRGNKISFSPTGRVTQNIGIPGTGLRYTRTLSTRRRTSNTGASQIRLSQRHVIPLDAWVTGISAYQSVRAIFSKVNQFSSNPIQPNDWKGRLWAAIASLLLIAWTVFSVYRRAILNRTIQEQYNIENSK